jgi:hypothetical protein
MPLLRFPRLSLPRSRCAPVSRLRTPGRLRDPLGIHLGSTWDPVGETVAAPQLNAASKGVSVGRNLHRDSQAARNSRP